MLSPQAKPADVAKMMKEADESGDGEVSWEEFMALMMKMEA